MDELIISDVTPENVSEQTLFCVRDVRSTAFENKRGWFQEHYEEGLRIKILKDLNNKMISFIEYLPADLAWRPVDAPGYMFIHCLYVYSNNDKRRGYATQMLKVCEEDANQLNMRGITVMTSKGSWVADKRLFEKNGFHESDRLERFELMVKKLDPASPDPKLMDWTRNRTKYRGWHLLYADQCPWHEKSVLALNETANEYGINLKVKKITTAREARNGPSGFGVFSLIYDGKLLEDHYISSNRFKNILNKELNR